MGSGQGHTGRGRGRPAAVRLMWLVTPEVTGRGGGRRAIPSPGPGPGDKQLWDMWPPSLDDGPSLLLRLSSSCVMQRDTPVWKRQKPRRVAKCSASGEGASMESRHTCGDGMTTAGARMPGGWVCALTDTLSKMHAAAAHASRPLQGLCPQTVSQGSRKCPLPAESSQQRTNFHSPRRAPASVLPRGDAEVR